MLLCVRKQPEKDIEEDTVYVWRGHQFEVIEEECGEEEFVERVIQQYWGSEKKREDIRITEEEPGEESDEFLNFFD